MDNPALNDATNSAMDVIRENDVVSAHIRMGAGSLLAWMSIYSLQDWVAIVTIIYILFQIGLLVPKYWIIFERIGNFFTNTIKKLSVNKSDGANKQ